MPRLLNAPSLRLGTFLLTAAAMTGTAQQERHGRGYKAPPPTAEVAVEVEKAFNGKPMANASVIFRAMRDGKLTANLETKTDPDGKAALDLLETGTHVTVQVIASGFATYATDFDLTGEGKQLLIKLQRPRAQVSTYDDKGDHPSEVQPGIQEHPKPKSTTVPAPPTPSPTAPLQTVPTTDSTDATQAPTPAKPNHP